MDGDGGHQQQQQWWKVVEEKLMKVREVSEVVAGPKWKTFIRKIGGVCRKNRRAQRGQFGYDAKGYALNFDGGLDWEDEDDDGQMYNARSSRFTGSSLAINSSE